MSRSRKTNQPGREGFKAIEWGWEVRKGSVPWLRRGLWWWWWVLAWGRGVVGDGTNQGQGENVPLLPRGIIGGAGYPQYFIPLSHLSLEFWETESARLKRSSESIFVLFAKVSPITHSIVNRVQPSLPSKYNSPILHLMILFFQCAAIYALLYTTYSLVSFHYWFCEMQVIVRNIMRRKVTRETSLFLPKVQEGGKHF